MQNGIAGGIRSGRSATPSLSSLVRPRSKRGVLCLLPLLSLCIVITFLTDFRSEISTPPGGVEKTSTIQTPLGVVSGKKFVAQPSSVPTHTRDGKGLLPVEFPKCAERLFETNYQRSERETPPQERAEAHLREAGIDHVYIVHYTPLRYRRGNFSAMLRQHGVRGEWVTGFDREVLNSETDRCFHSYDPKQFSGPKAARRSYAMGPSQRSVVIKHFSVLYDAYRRNYPFILVLEDDALLHAGFVMRLTEVMRDTPAGFDAIFIGGCMRMHAWRRKMRATLVTKHVYRKQSSRCSHALVASQAGVRKFLRSLPLTAPSDFQMDIAMREEQMDVYWVEPWLSVQGLFGEATCVTMTDIKGAGSCRFSTIKEYSKVFDIKFVNDTEVIARWDNVPVFHSRR